MDVRDAVEADADALAALADSPVDVMRNLVHDRTVRVAVDPDTTDGPASTERDTGGEEDASILGFVSFDAHESTVHVTQLSGSPAVCEVLLEEPLSFASREGMAVELLVPDGDETVRNAIEGAGFEGKGRGPRFEGRKTTRYRLETEQT